MSRDGLQRYLAQHGAITVAEFMAWCLSGEDDSYYRAAEPIGRSGDFITAPEISQTFGELIGLWAGAVWQAMGCPSPVMLIELGPGRGTLMSDALRAGRVVPGFLDAARLHLVEISERLRDAQRSVLSGFAPRWHERLDSVPDGPAIVIANEFFDALPIAQFIASGEGWRERVLRLDAEGRPVFAAGDPASLPETSSPPPEAEDGALIEARLSARPLIAELGRRARHFPLAALIIDYGYGRDAYGETLQAVAGHGYEDPLAAPGASDLSAHVNFAELARMAAAEELSHWGPIPQGGFLAGLGLEARLQRLISSARQDQRSRLVLGARRLVDPYQMGELFKAMALTSTDLPAPPPFADVDPAAAGNRGES